MDCGFLAIGECMVELAPTGAGTYTLGFAGDTFNTAWYLRRLLPPDRRVAYLTAVGTDAISDRLVAFMAAAGIGTEAVQRRTDSTLGLYLIEVENGNRRFSYWRSDSAARRLAAEEGVLHAALATAGVVYLSGITLAILPAGDRARLLAAVAAARARGAAVAFDPNIRPRLWPDAEAMRAALTAMAGAADILLPSFEDDAAAFGDPSPEATARRYAAAGAPLVVVKDGAGEIVTLGPEGLARHAPERAPALVDTTAAGDSFNAGFLAARAGGADLAAAVRQGARLAVRVIGAPGALVPV